MKRTTILGAALMLASSIAAAQGVMGGPGMGMMGGQGQGMMAALDLSDEQREKVLAIREENRRKNWAAMGELRAEQFKLRSLYRADKLDADKVVEQQKKVDALHQQMLRSRIEAHNQIAALLTPEQRKQLHHHAPRWMGHEDE